ncbi:hypothetical protein RI367_005515 [Sorochytrium milnesiophthora]
MTDATDIASLSILLQHPSTRQILLRSWAKLVLERFSEAGIGSEGLLQAALAWLIAVAGLDSKKHTGRSNVSSRQQPLVSLWDPDNTFARVAVFSACQSIFIGILDDDHNDTKKMLHVILQWCKMPDQLLFITADMLAWVNSFDGQYVSWSTDEIIKSILSARVIEPDPKLLRTMLKRYGAEKSHTDACAVTIQFMRSLVDTFLHHRGTDASYALKGTAQERRLIWGLDSMSAALVKHPLSLMQAPLLLRILNEVADAADGQPSQQLEERLSGLRQQLEAKQGTVSQSDPPMAVHGQEESLSAILAKCARQAKEHEEEQPETGAAAGHEEAETALEKQELLASLEGIWLQVDTDKERLVMNNTPGIQEQAFEETLISASCGLLNISFEELVWYGMQRDLEDDKDSRPLQPAWRLSFSNVQRYSIGKVIEAVTMPYSPRALSLLDSHRRDDFATGVKASYLSIFTPHAHFKLYPLFDNEAYQMIELMSTATGLAPYKESHLVKYTLAKKLDLTRRHIVYQLLQSENPWIEHSGELIRVVRRLTQEHEPQTIYDMELLYHSCRLEHEVTKEAIYQLRLVWHNSPSEMVRLKVLAIVDRLLDRSIMRQDDSNFITMYRWLRNLEENVSPYKSAEALRLILILLQRAKAIQIEPLMPLHQVAATIDHFAEYGKFFRFFNGGS